MKILLITPTSSQVLGFRLKLIEQMQLGGHEVSVITFDSEHKDGISRKNIHFFSVNDQNRGKNPFKLFSLKIKYFKLIKKIQPDIVFTFMLKPNIYGVLAANMAGIDKIFSMVEGAGDVFINEKLIWKLIRLYVIYLYRKSLKFSTKVFFLNKDDMFEFINHKIISESKTEIVNGIGIDLVRFGYTPVKNKSSFLMVARLLKNKGVYEFCECAREVKKIYPNAIFNLVGPEGDIKISNIQKYIDENAIVYHGYTQDVVSFYRDSTVFILPSYREGLPVSIMEAEAIGRMIITTETNGCRDTVIDGKNGFLVKVRDVNSLVKRVIWSIENINLVIEMGKCSRKFAESRFDQEKINKIIMQQIGLLDKPL